MLFFCEWIMYGDEYYETGCDNQMDVEDKYNIEPEWCPFCGGKIDINIQQEKTTL